MLKSLRDLFGKDETNAEVHDGPVTLADVLDRGWMDLFYQPKIELKSMKLVGAEGLVRARHPTRGALSPGTFLQGAGEHDILRLTQAVIIAALEDWEACGAL